MRWSEVALGVVAVGVVGTALYVSTHREHVYADEVRAEIAKQAPEIEECKHRLATIHDAWSAYTKDHKGSEPPSVEALFPKYLKDPQVLVCPTAQRWLNKKRALTMGQFELHGQVFKESYGLMWLTSGAVRAKRLLGSAAPLAVCQAHTEALYLAAYRKKMMLGVYTSDARQRLMPEVRDAKDLEVLRNGSIRAFDPAE